MAKDKTDATPELELEKLRLVNENLKLQLEIENKRNPKTPDELIEEQLERGRQAERTALAELAAGPYEFHVSLPGNFPTTHPRHAPHLVVGSSVGGEHGAREAIKKYNAHMGIIAPNPDKKYQVQEVGKPPQEIGNEAASQIEFTPASDGVQKLA